MEQLQKIDPHLPATIEELNEYILVGREKLKIYQSKVKVIDKLGLAKNVRDKTIEDGQMIAEAVLYAEARLGELLKETSLSTKRASSAKGTCSLPVGISKKQSYYAQQLANNPKIISEVIAEAFSKEELPTRKEVLTRVKKKNRHTPQPTPPLPSNTFNLILADPPWRYDFSKSSTRAIENQYPTMDLEEIKNLKIPASENSILFLWATMPKLPQAFEVIYEWGFTYKTGFVWVKDKIGMGYYARARHELLLISTKGNINPPLPENRFDSVIEAPRLNHSSKPTEIYSIIEKMYPNFSYLELFSRNKRKGWEQWGLNFEN